MVLLVVASFVGGCAGSTCGGIKAFRFLVMFKQAARELRLLVHPSAEIAIKVGHHTVPDRVIQAADRLEHEGEIGMGTRIERVMFEQFAKARLGFLEAT